MRYLKTLIVTIILIAIGIFVYQLFDFDQQDNTQLEEVKQQIVSDPNIKADNLTAEQKQQFLSRFEQARGLLLSEDFDSLQALNELAKMKKALGDIDGAVTAWEYASTVYPENSLPFANLALVYHYDLQDFEKAEKNYLISLANDPDQITVIRNLYQLYHLGTDSHQPDQEKAESLLIDAINNNPNSAELYALLGSFYKNQGQIKKAINAFNQHLKLNPDNQAVREEVERLKTN